MSAAVDTGIGRRSKAEVLDEQISKASALQALIDRLQADCLAANQRGDLTNQEHYRLAMKLAATELASVDRWIQFNMTEAA